MEAIHEIEIWAIALLQAVGAWLDQPMLMLTFLGSEEFNLLIIPTLYWCFDAALGLRMGLMLLLSTLGSTTVKMACRSPRPYWVSAKVQALSVETTFGMPSTHSSNAMAVWGVPFASTRSIALRIGLIALIFFIGFSRIFLGMHFISDVLAGWLLGGLILFAYLRIEPALVRYIRGLSLARMVGLALASAVLMIAVYWLVQVVTSGGGKWQIPVQWEQNAMSANAEKPIDPFNLDNAFTTAGTWFGMLAGVAWLYRRQGRLFDASGAPHKRLLRYLIGLVGIFVLWYLVGKVFPRNPDLISYTLRFVRYTLVGLWVSVLAPLLFQRLGLANVHAAPTLSTGENTL